MPFLALMLYLGIAIVAAAFVATPILLKKTKPLRARIMLAAAAVLFVWGIGGGAYLMLGQPQLAARDFVPAEKRDLNGVISLMAEKLRRNPEPNGLLLLGRAYLSIGDADDAVKAFATGIAVSKGRPSVDLLLAYADATLRKDGKLTEEAERALNTVLADDPDNASARALLSAGNAIANPPDIGAMVAGLAARLKTEPGDAEGWRRLIRAYVVLGDEKKLAAALADARAGLAKDPKGLAAVEAEAIRRD